MKKREKSRKRGRSTVFPAERAPGSDLLLGAHMSIEGGIHKALGRGKSLGCTAIQIFTKNASQWRAPPLTDRLVRDFKSERKRTGIQVIAHDAYLINLGSPQRDLREKSVAAFIEEMERAERLEIPCLVMHPGAHTGSGEDAGILAVISSFDEILRHTAGFRVQILVENTAGQGSALGSSFDHLRRIVHSVNCPERMGICFDTCHAFAAGYDLRDRNGYERTFSRLNEVVGLALLKAIHLNDCKKGLGMRVDRHEHIGLGTLGIEPFRLIMNDPHFRQVPKIIETPKFLDGKDMDRVNLGRLKELVSEEPLV